MEKRLRNHPSFKASDATSAAKELAKSYQEHQVIVAPGEKLHAVHHEARLSKISINYLEYGANVEIVANPLEDFYLVEIPISGTTKDESNGEKQLVKPGTGMILGCNTMVSQYWSADCSQIQIKIDRKEVELQLSRMLGTAVKKPVIFDPMVDLDEPKMASWWRFIEFLISEFESDDSTMISGAAVPHIEQAIILNLLNSQGNNYSQALLAIDSSVVPAHVKKAEQYIRDNIANNISIHDLVQVCDVSERALYDGFRRFRHTTPMNYLRSYRMEVIRQDLLLKGNKQSVTDIATRWGVTQLGRFAAMYKLVYGESPSETLKRS